jgi:DNA-binding NtrC family response regulator
MTFPALGRLADADPVIRITIVCEPDTNVLADSIEELLANEKVFVISRIDYHSELGLQRKAAEVRNPDVVVATLGTFHPTNTDLVFASLQHCFPHRPVLITTTHPDMFDFAQVFKMGASDFLAPPLRRFEFLARLARLARLKQRGDVLAQKLKEDNGLKHIIGESPALVEKIRCIPRFARCDATVLISGESGTGKEIFGRAIHFLSARAGRSFVPINCGALPENLVESEIFGHTRGAFTGAVSNQAGLIREAEGGTLFLDEIDCLTPQMQVKLLRFLQDGEYRSVGSQQIRRSNIRVIAATNADFNAVLSAGKFREDLYYRLNVLALTLPPLRERAGDIVLLAHDFLYKQAAITKTQPKILSLAALHRLLSHSWPGNVRELQNLLMRAIVLSDHGVIEASDIDLPDEVSIADDQSFQAMKSRVVWRFEHDFLLASLRAHQGNISRAASAAKKNRRAFWELLRKHDLLAVDSRR